LTHAPLPDRAKIRDDLIRRLFAVAISVGAATTLSQMKWVLHGRAPCFPEYQQLLILLAAMFATVLSWDGYLFSIAQRPLTNTWRFAIDILLVFIYMVLLMTSKLLVWWVFLHAFIYLLYVIWDSLSVRDWLPQYYKRDVPQTVLKVYAGGFRNSLDVSWGPVITIVLAVYFWSLYLLNDRLLSRLNVPGLNERIAGTMVFVILGLLLYRKDKQVRFKIGLRIVVVAGLLIVDGLYLALGPIDSTIWNRVGQYIGSASCDL
jgi:hypothetical protein